MRRRIFLTGLSAALTGLSTALPNRARAAGPLRVVASFSILAGMARRIGGGRVEVVSLVPANTDAHGFQPGAAESRALAAAAVLIENGLGLEGWMARLGTAAGFTGTRVTAAAGVTPRLTREGKVTSTDPHAWQNPRNGVLYAEAIARGLMAADPEGADVYTRNLALYTIEIDTLDVWIANRFAAISKAARRIITTHDAFGYYGDRYGITFLAAQGISADAEPSAKAIATLIRQIRREKVRTVFLENMSDPKLATMLARETGATLSGPLFSDALSAPDGPAPDYLAMLKHNTSLFARAMQPAA